jgi:hypothetical protein
MHFVTLRIKAKDNFIPQFTLCKKSVHGMIFLFYSHFQNKIIIAMEF